MRIVAIADTHTYHDDLGPLPYGELLIHAGDLLQRGTLDELQAAARWLKSQPHPHKIFVAGNHDLCFEQSPSLARALLEPEVIYLQDSAVTIKGLNIWGSPWQPRFHDWAFMLDRGAPLKARWDLIPPNTDLLITHGPPHGFGDRVAANMNVGCPHLLEAVNRVAPCLHVYGHIHQDPGAWPYNMTLLANVTTNEGEEPASVFNVIDGKAQLLNPFNALHTDR